MEIGAAFLVGAVAGGWVAGSIASVKKAAASVPPPPLPPPLPMNVVHREKKMKKKIIDLHLGDILNPATGEDTRKHGDADVATEDIGSEEPAATGKIKLVELLSATSKLKKAPKLLSMEEKRSLFEVPPLFVELLKNTHHL